ncbi:MAG: glutamate transport system substrate-binding protein [Miltoncostaeaceae bacterium]|jgi:glutamate transport system substrate-binding protein|nr:glutamate transport system substrate-binding protein [Miltoncostaeaceae bacterium]
MAIRPWRWLAALALCAAVLAGAACGGDDDEGDSGGPAAEAPAFPDGSTMDKIQDRGKIIVGTKFDQPLFGLKNPTNDEIEGFDVEIAKRIAEGIFGEGNADGKVQFVETPSKVRETVIRQGRVDVVVATYTINDERKQQVDFAGPYYVAGQDIMVRADEDGIASVDDLNGRKVCSAQGSTSIDNVREKAPQADLSITFDLYSLCAEALQDGRVDAVSTDNGILAGLVQASDGKLKLVEAPFTEEPYGIGLKKGDDAFRAFLNDRIEAIEDDGSWEEAFKSTVGTVISEVPEPPAIDRY